MSAIEWTDRTWNPVRGCTRVSEGCRNCYAERMARRLSAEGFPYHGFAEAGWSNRSAWTGRVELIPEKLDEPLRWKKPARVFVNSMSDLFHENLSGAAILAVFSIMARAPHLTFQVLTKRPVRMRSLLVEWAANGLTLREGVLGGALPNVWLGVSVEDQRAADERVPHLLQTPAAGRFVSYEPALGPADFSLYFGEQGYETGGPQGWTTTSRGLDWVIVGGESGPGARPFDVAWARSVVAQCREAGVPVFVKQLGARPRFDEQTEHADWLFCEIKHPKGSDPTEWPKGLRVREFPR